MIFTITNHSTEEFTTLTNDLDKSNRYLGNDYGTIVAYAALLKGWTVSDVLSIKSNLDSKPHFYHKGNVLCEYTRYVKN